MSFSDLSPEQQRLLLDGPAIPPPDGITPNFDDPSNGNTIVLVSVSICIAFATLFVFARIYAVWFVLKTPTFIDYWMLVSFGLYICFCAIPFRVCLHSTGLYVHQWNYRLRDIPDTAYLFFVGTNIAWVLATSVKAMLIAEWLRMFFPRGSKGPMWWGCHAILVYNFAFAIGALIAYNLQCTPHEKIWNRTMDGSCWSDANSRILDVTSAVHSVVVDLAILLVPQKVIWGLHMGSRKKLRIGSMFTIGSVGIVSAAFRLQATIRYLHTTDITFNFTEIILWAVAEQTSGLMVLSMPVLPKAFSALGSTKAVTSIRTRLGGSTVRQTAPGTRDGSSWIALRNTTVEHRQYGDIDEVALTGRIRAGSDHSSGADGEHSDMKV